MAGLFPSIANSQSVDENGLPLAFSVLTVYNSGTLQLSSVYQDIGLAIPAANPMTADITGRLPIFYVGDGVYRVRLVDKTGILIYDYPQVASIGASSTGGGGQVVDPTTVFSTGDELWKKIGSARTGWVRQNALTIGSATSGGTERANTDCHNLFLYLWANYPNAKCPVVGGRGVSAAADWAANKQITLPDMRGYGGMGKDAMGNVRANRISDADVTSGGGDTGDTDAATGGSDAHAIGQANLPNVSFAVTDPGHVHIASSTGAFAASQSIPTPGTGASNALSTTNEVQLHATNTGSATTGITVASGGAGTALPTLDFFALGTWYIKL